ncbi:hypothetical protein [Coraliomargarita parva]|uniref:hypothetical protein n=1 Tax=Coraliomargarita parva TaxID=3014050 RepID=UPI0022B42EF9|nr:hypothetical protein [Coraliomargarita parva]
MDWAIKSFARKSALTEQAFTPGDRIVCLIFKQADSPELGRADLLETEVDGFQAEGEVLGRWTRIVKDPGDEAQQTRETMASAEDFFFSLFEVEDPEAKEESDALKHLLALMLERKRVLRAQGARQTAGAQDYLHVKSKRVLSVPIVEISPALMLRIQDTIGEIIL